MNQMEIFKNPEFGSIRVIEENGKYLFCGTDVAAALGYSNSRDAIIRHCRYVVKRDAPHPQSPDRKISMTFIPEGDLYRLIVHSKLPSAEQFEQWVFDEVLPGKPLWFPQKWCFNSRILFIRNSRYRFRNFLLQKFFIEKQKGDLNYE